MFFTSRPTDTHEKFRKRPKNLPLCVKTPEMTPPPPVKRPYMRVARVSIRYTSRNFPVRAEFWKNVVSYVGVCCTFLKSPRKRLFEDVSARAGVRNHISAEFGQKSDASSFLGSVPVWLVQDTR